MYASNEEQLRKKTRLLKARSFRMNMRESDRSMLKGHAVSEVKECTHTQRLLKAHFYVLQRMSTIMNARTQLFELSMEGRQVDEAVASIFHSVLFHRSLGKFTCKDEGSYSVGTVGYQDVDCDFIDFTYVCCSSIDLDQRLKREISGFSEALRSTDSPGFGQISLEFFQRKKKHWPFQPECIPWEVWTVRLELIKLATEHERQICREKVGDLLTDKILYITEIMNRHDYLPKMPDQAELDLIFDISYPDIQPYLFKLSFTTTGPPSLTMGNTMKKLIKETLSK